MHLPLTLSAQERNNGASATGPADRGSLSTCQSFGQIFGTDPFAGEMLVKAPSGSIEVLLFDETTVFTAVSFDASSNGAPIPLAAEAVNVGDWICARTVADDDDNEKRAATILVAPRQEIQRQQRETLARWLGGGAFGTVIQVKQKSKSIVLECHRGGNTEKVFVNTSEKTRFHRDLWDSVELSDIAPASWAQVRLGERMYVHGSSSVDATSLNATLVIFGDLQAVAGTISAINPLDETVGLNELITDKAVMVHVKPGGLRLISPVPERSQHEDGTRARVRQPIDFGDIREGDSVIVLVRQDESSGTKMDGLGLVVNFGEPTAQGVSQQQVTWKLMPVQLGLP